MGVARAIDITAAQRKISGFAQKASTEHHRLGLRLPRHMERVPAIRPGHGGLRNADPRERSFRPPGRF